MKTSPEVTALFTALSIAQGSFLVPKKTKTNKFFNNAKYSDLSDVIDAIKEGLAKNDLSVIQGIEILADNSQILVTRLSHKTGQWIETVCPLYLDKKTMQGLGSANSYARRYALSSILGVASEDDDGNEASEGAKKPGEGDAKSKSSALPPKGTPPKVGPSNSKGHDQKIEVGAYTGKTFSEVIKADSAVDFKLARWAHREMTSFKKIHPCYVAYVEYCFDEGVEL